MSVKIKKSLKSVMPALGILVMLGLGAVKQIPGPKPKPVMKSKYCLGFNIDNMDNGGCNYFCYELKRPGLATVGNTTKYYCSWYME